MQADLLLNRIRQRVAWVLGLDPAEPLDPQEPLMDLGVDSLVAIELRNLLSSDLGQQLPATITFPMWPNRFSG